MPETSPKGLLTLCAAVKAAGLAAMPPCAFCSSVSVAQCNPFKVWPRCSWLCMRTQARGEGVVLDQFANTDNSLAHYTGTGPELWEQTGGRITHFISSMGTTGMLCSVLLVLLPGCSSKCSMHMHPD